MKTSQLKQMPIFKTDKEAENFVDTADLTDYDLTNFKPVHFEFLPKKDRKAVASPSLTDEEFICHKPAKKVLSASFFKYMAEKRCKRGRSLAAYQK
ncbi:CopG family antitoxin [Bartonella sp. CB60]|uniref:CopG family antitoxin n=1 Tax=Bartonella sp. CB60 TaxID=3113619 RepID=UPI00300DFB6D